jgi:hypothetical protein
MIISFLIGFMGWDIGEIHPKNALFDYLLPKNRVYFKNIKSLQNTKIFL